MVRLGWVTIAVSLAVLYLDMEMVVLLILGIMSK